MKLLAIFFVFFISNNLNASEKLISLSFDDAPRSDSWRFKGEKRAEILIEALKKANVSQTIFYANPGKITTPEGLERLKKYQRAGHLIGNHTFTHPWAKKVTVKEYIEDFEKAHEHLQKHNLLSKYFRYPFLDRGKTWREIKEVHKHIMSRGYIDGYVTVDNWDWHMDSLLQKALSQKKAIDYKQLGNFYVDTIMESVNFYYDLTLKTLKKSAPQILLLHENDLAALYIPKLVERLRSEGWKIISPTESYTVQELTPLPKTTVHGQGRIVALAASRGESGKLNSGFEDYEILNRRFKSYKVIK
ncbi:MAG: polysaccharide deacetylase family protein [Bacteriovoracaceae bacterium]